MGVLSIISSVNKVAIIAFFITMVLIVVEISMLLKERRSKKKPVMQEFDDKAKSQVQKIQKLKIKEKKQSVIRSPNQLVIIILIAVFLFIALTYTLLQFFSSKSFFSQSKDEKQNVQIVSSKGIKLFDENWTFLAGLDVANLNEGDIIYIGLVTINEISGSTSGPFIDKARIRVNSDQWSLEDETAKLNNTHKVYYIKYTIPKDASSLKIEAQLHDAEKGWLGQ